MVYVYRKTHKKMLSFPTMLDEQYSDLCKPTSKLPNVSGRIYKEREGLLENTKVI